MSPVMLITDVMTDNRQRVEKNQLFICESIFNKLKNQLSISSFGDRALNYYPEFKCSKYKCPNVLVINLLTFQRDAELCLASGVVKFAYGEWMVC